MTITLQLPDDIALHANAGREFRSEFDDFLIEQKIEDHAFNIEDLRQDLAPIDRVREQGLFSR